MYRKFKFGLPLQLLLMVSLVVAIGGFIPQNFVAISYAISLSLKEILFHQTHEAIRAHVLLCFMALMMSKFLEIKTGLSIRRIRDIIWNVHEAHIVDKLTKKAITLQTNMEDFNGTPLAEILLSH